jgi:hypothetical protein
MIARHRGDMRIHSRWRPVPRPTPLEPSESSAVDERLDAPMEETASLERQDAAAELQARRSRAPIAIATLAVLALIAGHQTIGHRAAMAALPGTPREWVDQWTAAALNDPGKVCGRLFSPALTAAFPRGWGRTCNAYFASARLDSFRILRVLQDGDTAAVEGREVAPAHRGWGYFTMLLNRTKPGWRAIDIVPGGPVRPR